jgi:hypothetical protein
MRGVDNLIAMRLRGMKPCAVWVELLPMKQWVRKFTQRPDRHVGIHLEPSDITGIELADLRCLKGLHVMVNGPQDDTTERVARACFKAGAKVVEAFWFDITNPERIHITKGLRLSEEGEKTVWQS